MVPQWTYGRVRAARWDRFSRPEKLPEYGNSAFRPCGGGMWPRPRKAGAGSSDAILAFGRPAQRCGCGHDAEPRRGRQAGSTTVDCRFSNLFNWPDDPPEPAYEKGRSRQAEVILARITHNVLVAQKFTFYRFHGPHEAGIAVSTNPISGSNSTLASRSSIPIAAGKAPRFSFQA
jgi:hypothetical protein